MKHKLSDGGSPYFYKFRKSEFGSSWVHHNSTSVDSLLDLSAKMVAECLPFEYVEKMLVHIPEPVQEKIIYYSFPRRDSDIYTYASFHPKGDKCRDKIPYYEGLDHFQNGCVEDVVQIGFHLTGCVKQQNLCVSPDSERRKFEVSITFDRCKIISVCCDCGNKGLSWCPHVVALAIFRIRQPHLVDYRSPISDALVRMDRSQLQKFAQYLIASHPNKVLPSAQHLADQLLQPESNINKTSGAPDPTAGASVEDVAAWYLDEAGVREQLRTELASLVNAGGASSSGLSSINNFANSVSTNPRSSGGRSTPLVMAGHAPGVVGPNGSGGAVASNHVSESDSSEQFASVTSTNHEPNTSEVNSSIDHPPLNEVGLHWLLRYRRFLFSQNLFSPTHQANGNHSPCPFSNLDVTSYGVNNFVLSSAETGAEWFSVQPNSILGSVSGPDSSHSCGASHGGAGSQITAMFSKVRELLAKRDSNGPRLLSLITEELLRCPKLPLLKARRSHRGIVELSTRIHTPGLARSASAHQLSSPTMPFEPTANSTSAVPNSTQLPGSTTRLWDEVCVLWTCVVLNPDCSPEARRNWRNRFLSWSRAHRCPRDEAYAVPDHFFPQLRDSSELEEDGASHPVQSSLGGHLQQSNNRSSRRVSVFQLPLEVSFMSWDDDWLRHLLGLDLNKRIKGKTGAAFCDYDSCENTSNSSIDLDDSSSETFRRPSIGTPRRNSTSGRPPSNSSPSATPRDCHCPYCDLNMPLGEPFPLLCLRVAALRSNGYVAQAIRLAVFISQRLLRSFKFSVSHASSTGVIRNLQQQPQQLLHPYPPPYYAPPPHHLVTDALPRRPTFTANSSGLRSCGPGSLHGPNRFTPAVKALSPSPMSAHAKYPPGRLPSPRPSSVSPPVSSSVTGRPVSRRHVMSPGMNLTPGPSGCSNQFNWSGHNSCSSLPPSVYKVQPPPPYGVHSQSFVHQPVCHSNASPNTPFNHFSSKHPSHPHSFRSPPINPHSSYGSGPMYPPGRSLTSPKLSGRTSSSHPARTSTSPCGSPNSDNQADYFVLLSGTSSTACLSHTESGWIGLPGRPVLCLIECLLDAAAMAVEISHCTSAITRPWVQLESASFYLCLSIKVSLLALLQQRRLSGSVNRLLACQGQESRLLALLNTMPKDTTTLLAVCEALSYLLGPPTLPRQLTRMDNSPGSPAVSWSVPNWCWWSALGPVIHPDSYPVHAVAHFVLDYILEAQKQNQLTLVNNCWAGFGNTAPSVRMEDLLYAVVTRAMRFSALESVSDNLGLPSTAVNRGNFVTESTSNILDHQSRARTPFPQSHWDGNPHTFDSAGDLSSLATGTPGHSIINEPPGYTNPNSVSQSDHSSTPGFHSHHPNTPRAVHGPADFDRCPLPQPHYPPLPSAFANAVQACLRLSDSCYLNSSSCAPIPPVVPNPITSPMCFSRTQPTATHNPEQVPMVVYQQNGNLRRCLEMLERQQTQLAISLIRLSKSHVQRLDQTVQICDRHIHSAVSLLTISQQIFADAVGLDPAVSSTSNYDPVHLFKSSLLPGFGNGVCQLGSSSSASSVMLPTPTTHFGGGSFTRDRTNLISAAFYLALLVVLRTLSRTVHWRRREMLAWSASTALHVGPSACLYLVTHWSSYVSPREAVNWLAPTLLSVLNKSGSGVAPQEPKPNAKPADQTCVYHPVHCSEPSLCSEHALLFGYVNSDVYMSSDLPSPGVIHPSWPPWYGFSQAPLVSRGHTNSIAMAAQLLSSAVPYSANARDHISAAVRTMAMQAAAKDPVNCALPALALAERSPAAFDAVYRLVLHSAGTGGLGPVQLFSLARYMDSRGWAWRAFPFALHATRLFVLSTMQDSHPVAGHVLWACSLAHRLGPGPLQELLNHVIRNIHCPTLLTEILYRCRIPPAGLSVNGPGVNPANGATVDLLSPSSLPPRNPPTNFGSSTPYYHLENGKLLSLDRPPLKCLLDAAINAFVTATHTRLSNISPRQYAEFVDFLTRARDTFHLLRPDGPAQFRSLVECLRQTYRGKRKLVSLLAERFG
ncbi:hypothetical protein CRM22_003449 [Opisthorchis felineus]|uniref:SWIM-type domain-containing protein n=1 Tax=Opisthorchis felineus TaxID=147828 RepID=A0A4S2M628_OPIFE|nr:hypothetical protein CRM22_003449 [Opisthorchis felineus]